MKKIQKQILISLKNPVIRNHLVYGQHLLPGVSYIDLIYQVFKEQGHSYKDLQLRNLSVHYPLTVGENYQTILTIHIAELERGILQVIIEGETRAKDNSSSQKKLHMKAEAHLNLVGEFPEVLDISAYKQSAHKITEISAAYEQCRRQQLVHTDFMKLDGEIYQGDEGILMDLSVPLVAQASANRFLFHPALMDGSGVGANVLLYPLLKGEQRLFIPLFYESFRACEPLQAHCFARVQSSSVRYENELVYITIEFFNAMGIKIGELVNFTSKIVREADLVNPERMLKREQNSPSPRSNPSNKGSSSDCSSDRAETSRIEGVLCRIWATYLQRPERDIQTEVGYYEMGLDSPRLLAIVEDINSQFQTNLPPTLLFEYTTIAKLAVYLAKNCSPCSPALKTQTVSTIVSDQRVNDPVKAGDIAIIGIKGRYPKAKDLEEFWKNLVEGKDCITEVPSSRWDWRDLNGISSPSGKDISKWGGFIDDPDCFDPQFFRISPREAETMDPQERLFLEVCWETIEDAGYTPKTLTQPKGVNARNNVGVFVGVMHKDYTLIGAENLSKENLFTLSLNYAPIANRVSYFCNFHGPSLAIDTVCSSSLTALHIALESLRQGECEVALAGGVNLSFHPNKYITYGMAGMFASDGYCHTFGKGGDGYVPAEGVGVVLLKPLERAVEDEDQIYAVIKASAVNHVGAVSGITVPSSIGQADLIEKCLEKAKIHPRTISYIEAHGTGTSLGDPIEVEGLVKAFSAHTQDLQFCAIGSLKSNMGHAESAAGISGLTKVVLQLKHQTLVPSLHSEELNPYLDLPNTPFYVQHKTESWKRPVIQTNGKDTIYPLRAGISSFGATGSNAHVILEEYVKLQKEKRVFQADLAMIPLSAKNKERLHAYANKLLFFLQDEMNVFDVAYTLQVGREAMEERVVFLVQDIPALIEKLRDFTASKREIPYCWTGHVKNNKTIREEIEPEIRAKKWDQIASFWVRGGEVFWEKLYDDIKPCRLHLPTYPFSKESYWLPQGKKPSAANHSLHPLLHDNTSDLAEQRFSSSFTGREFFLRDHVVNGMKMLPGVAVLEMARAAAEMAVKGKTAIALTEVLWIKPIIVANDSVTVHIGLYPEKEQEISFEIYSDAEPLKESTLYSQGKIQLLSPQEASSINLEDIQTNCQQYEILSDLCYSTFERMGLHYGESHRGIHKLYVGNKKVLARLFLPPTVLETEKSFVLHPTILDSALQAAMGLKMSLDGTILDDKLKIPFAIERVEIFAKCTPSMWAYIQYTEGAHFPNLIEKVDIDLCDDDGKIAVRIRGLSSRALENVSPVQTLFFTPKWAEPTESQLSFQEKKVFLCEDEDVFSQGTRVFLEVQSILKRKLEGPVLLQVVAPVTGDKRLLSALSGLLKTAHLENPSFYGQLIEADEAHKIFPQLDREKAVIPYSHLRSDQGKLLALTWHEEMASSEKIPWKENGVYLITGGLGGLGWIFAQEIAKRSKNPVLILVGRSPLDEKKRSQIQELERLGSRAVYQQKDVAHREEVEELIGWIRKEWGTLQGIIHSAGIVQDSFIIRKNIDSFADVLSAKIRGTINLDEATQDLSLDVFILFSSGAGAVGNIGQADYAMGNAFLNSYAEYRAAQRPGQTLSIMWPLWKEGGMQVEAEIEERMAQSSGMRAMKTETGISALYRALALEKPQVVVVEGDAKRIRAFLQAEPNLSLEILQKVRQEALEGEEFQEKAEQYLKNVLSTVLKLAQNRIDSTAPLENYGIDSMLIVQMTNQLEKVFGPLSKTLFFEYQNIRDLAAYFVRSHFDLLKKQLGVNEKIAEKPTPENSIQTLARRPRARYLTQEAAPLSIDIAVIGLAGKYPQAKNIQEFWNNLQEGKDCITEIPKERWNHDLYFDEDKTKVGKTYSKWGGFIQDVDAFDPLFFQISPRDAELIDPQERLFLQCVYETIEDAGYTKDNLQTDRSVGVYVGVMYEEYQLYGAQEQERGRMIALSGNPASIANRVSYFFNFQGPSIALDTMCSSSLTALHLACESLKHKECEVAIAGGVNLSLHPNKYLMLGQGKFVSSKGRCESFGVGGDGYVPGEGVGAILLKPLAKAIQDNDHIYGILKGSAINHGGKTNGYSVPNPHGQAYVIKKALQEAKIDPRTISYIEAHGTGTSLGDPIEIAGLSKVFREYTQDTQFCALGSAKSNIGHCESAAGIAGLTKILLQMKEKKLVPSLHSSALNPHIDFRKTPFSVQQVCEEWRRPVINGIEQPRRAGLSGFGAGGANAHVLVEEYIPRDHFARQDPFLPFLIILSAQSKEQLQDQAKQLLSTISNQNLADIAYTLQVGREAFSERIAFLASHLDELREKLTQVLEKEPNINDFFQGQTKSNKDLLDVFVADEDMNKTIEAWVEKRKYSKILELWVKGLAIDWNRLYGDDKPRRVSLPTYPFLKQRYWVPGKSLQSPFNQNRSYCFLDKQWEYCASVLRKKEPKNILLLSNEETESLAREVAHYFSGHHILSVEPEELVSFEADWKSFDGLIDLVGCGNKETHSNNWIICLQKLIDQGSKKDLFFLCVTKELEPYKNQSIRLSGAARAGLYRMLQSEYSYLRSRHMDVDNSCAISLLAECIHDEFFSEGEEPEVCYRKGKRYRSFFARMANDPLQNEQTVKSFPEENVLLITGGTSGLGLLCAEHFVKKYRVKRLVLTGREVIPPREHWDPIALTTGSLGKKIRAIQKLEQQGVHVLALSLELSNEKDVERALREIKQNMGSIGGVIYCAGSLDKKNPAFIRKNLEEIDQVLSPKIRGLNTLFAAVYQEPLEFFVLFSSVAAAIPALGSGQSDYTMANAYMDYFSASNRAICPLISIQWPSWKETGMGEAKGLVYAETGLQSLTNEEGLRLLDEILIEKPGVILPAVIDASRFDASLLMGRRKKDNLSKPEIQQGKSEIGDAQDWFIHLLSKELKLDRAAFDIDKTFQEYGIDSVILAQIVQQINQKISGQLDPSILYEYPTIRAVSDWLAKTHGQRFTIEPAGFHPLVSQKLSSKSREVFYAEDRSEDIAVIGMSCRFPGAETLHEYWRLLAEGRSAIRPIGSGRWGTASSYHAGILDPLIDFDPDFFHISPEDVRAMDPQALLLLEACLKLWYDAGYMHQEIKGKKIGVYIGGRSQQVPQAMQLQQMRNPILAVGQNYLAANISQCFDLRGPSVVLDTACSSALVSMNMAIQALRNGDIEAAVVGGVSLLQTQSAHQLFAQRGILSKEAAFHIFDERSEGMILGEGVGVVLLKTVKQALLDKNRIDAVIKGISVNNDGKTAGPTAPSFESQKLVMQEALRKSGKRPEEIGYIEANGSGSKITDLLELKAIQSVYRPVGSGVPLSLGSMKPNIGHPLCAEGIASFIKVVLMLKHRQEVPFLSGEQKMVHFDMEAAHIYFSRKLEDWREIVPLVAINCFADGGTNVHLLVEAYKNREEKTKMSASLAPPTLKKMSIFQSLNVPLEREPMAQGVQNRRVWRKAISGEGK